MFDGIITRHLINPDISLKTYSLRDNVLVEQEFNRDDISVLINRAKTYLIKEKNCQPGQTIFLADVLWPSYLAWFFAGAELGLNFVVSEFSVDQNNYKFVEDILFNTYGKIDFYIGVNEHRRQSDTFICRSEFIVSNTALNYPDQSQGNTIWATPDTVLIQATTSGTTGEPKVIKHNHQLFFGLMDRNAKVYGLDNNNRCLHTKILHHGSVIGVYFLPTMKHCRYHYWLNFKDYAIMTEVIQKERIDKVLLFYDMIDNLYHTFNKKVHDDLTMFVLGPTKPSYLQKFVGMFKYQIVSIFGCTETSGPLFLQYFTPSNYRSKLPIDFGLPLDDFYKITVDKEFLTVTMPDGSVVVTGDKFKVDKSFLFLGRGNLYRIKGIKIYPNEINRAIEKFLSTESAVDFDLAVDQEKELLYLRTNKQINLEELNQQLIKEINTSAEISLLVVEDRLKFMGGIKFNAQMFRKYCRTLL